MALQPPRFAVIDMGTNTFHLLVAESTNTGIIPVLELKKGVRIGQGGITKGFLTTDAMQRAEDCLKDFIQAAKGLGVSPEAIQVFATSAVRSANNGADFVKKIKEELGLTIQVIEGDKEAEYIFYSVLASGALNDSNGNSLIMDIGGGSVEFILGDKGGHILWKQSFEIGGQRLLDGYMQADPILPSEADRLKQDLVILLTPLLEACSQHKPYMLVGASGTFDTLRVLEYSESEFESIIAWKTLSIDKTILISNYLQTLNRAQRLAIPGVSELRADMIVVALILLEVVLSITQVKALRQSSYALKEGVASLWGRNSES